MKHVKNSAAKRYQQTGHHIYSFTKAGRKPVKDKSNPTGILHLASDCVLINIKDKYKTCTVIMFPLFKVLSLGFVLTFIFSNALRKVVLFELTCPHEQSMVNWHSPKLWKYSSLVEIIGRDKWGCLL